MQRKLAGFQPYCAYACAPITLYPVQLRFLGSMRSGNGRLTCARQTFSQFRSMQRKTSPQLDAQIQLNQQLIAVDPGCIAAELAYPVIRRISATTISGDFFAQCRAQLRNDQTQISSARTCVGPPGCSAGASCSDTSRLTWRPARFRAVCSAMGGGKGLRLSG